VTPEVRARRTLAAVIFADFTREAQGSAKVDWLVWANRLGHALGGLLAALDAADAPAGGREAFAAAAFASSGVAPDGSARLSPGDLLTVLGALEDGAEWAGAVACRGEDAAAYRALARSLGDDR
jgi:hypothetical protein